MSSGAEPANWYSGWKLATWITPSSPRSTTRRVGDAEEVVVVQEIPEHPGWMISVVSIAPRVRRRQPLKLGDEIGQQRLGSLRLADHVADLLPDI